jgi:hypothetical protein
MTDEAVAIIDSSRFGMGACDPRLAGKSTIPMHLVSEITF